MIMAITKEDLRDFSRFADERLQNGETCTLVELVREWESRRRERNSDLANCVIQVDPETLQKLAKAFPVVHDEEQLRRALARRGGVTTAEMLGNAVLAAARTARE
jgi:hypothetical protein